MYKCIYTKDCEGQLHDIDGSNICNSESCNGCEYSAKVVKEVIKGVGTDAPTVTNEQGGKQSKCLYNFVGMDAKAMFKMARVLQEGKDKYGDDENWRKISIEDHLNHLITHAYAYLAGDRSDEHLSHIMCRAKFACAVEIQNK